MPAFRPLPSRPSLAFERKEAKALLRRMRSGEPEALDRAAAWHPTFPVESTQLADAQLVIAREYGFASWPRLVRYFEDVERQTQTARHTQGSVEYYERSARRLLAAHRQQRRLAARSLAAYVPRFYGWKLEDVFAAQVAEDDARLATARSEGFPCWQALLERIAADALLLPDDPEVSPLRPASLAIAAADIGALERAVDEHPSLLTESWPDLRGQGNLMSLALAHERKRGSTAMRPVLEWLANRGFNLRETLSSRLCGHMRMDPEMVRWLLERGADPNWVAPNGIPVLEHALLCYWNAEAVDVLAAHATPRHALWIAAGLGEVEGVARFLEADGRPTPEARRLRPDFTAVGAPGIPARHPDPTDEEVLMEAFFVAALNARTNVLGYMASRGFDVNTLVWDSPILNVAVGNAWVSVVECLMSCGANPDLKGWQPTSSAREVASEILRDMPDQPDRRRVVELLGLDPDAVLAAKGG
jgi:hypothetical protein